MKRRKLSLLLCIVMVFVLMTSVSALANDDRCTIMAVGKNATVDGSAIVSYNCDCTDCDFRMFIIPAMDWPEGSIRDIISWGHYNDRMYDFSNKWNIDFSDIKVGEMPEAPHTYRYIHTIDSNINEKGLLIGESTCGIDSSTEYGKEVKRVLQTESKGIIDYDFAMDIVLERCSTPREAVRVLGDLIETYGWIPESGECFNITDGKEVWIFEVYGLDLWAAFKLPDDEFFVCANRHRIRDIDLDDSENVMHSPNLVSFAVEQGWYNPDSGEPFRPADIYSPNDRLSSTRREWRALDLVAPSLGLSPHETVYPQTVKPGRELSVHDIFKISGDYYQGTEYDLSKGPQAGPYGNPLRASNVGEGAYERGINDASTVMVFIGQAKEWLPDPIKSIAWYGIGAADSTYITPISPIMKELPKPYMVGNKFGVFDRDSLGWINIYVQELAQRHYCEAIKDIYSLRDPKLEMLYEIVPLVQEHAAEVYKTDPEAAANILHQFYYSNALSWYQQWKDLGDMLLSKYAFGRINLERCGYPEWWNELIDYKPLVR